MVDRPFLFDTATPIGGPVYRTEAGGFMGWLWGCYSRQDQVNEILRDYKKEPRRLIKHWSTCFGKRLWVAYEYGDQGTGICLHLLDKDRQGYWGYKDICETMGPYYYDCPKEAIALTNGFNGNANAIEWRAKVMARNKK